MDESKIIRYMFVMIFMLIFTTNFQLSGQTTESVEDLWKSRLEIDDKGVIEMAIDEIVQGIRKGEYVEFSKNIASDYKEVGLVNNRDELKDFFIRYIRDVENEINQLNTFNIRINNLVIQNELAIVLCELTFIDLKNVSVSTVSFDQESELIFRKREGIWKLEQSDGLVYFLKTGVEVDKKKKDLSSSTR